MVISIGSDHAGIELKAHLISEIERAGHTAVDVGTNSPESCDYADFALAVSRDVIEGRADRGIVLCGSGIGASVAANKVPGIIAGNVSDTYSAHQGVEHDDMNVLVIGARTVGIAVATEILHAFLNATFDPQERFIRRLNKVKLIEQTYSKS